MKIADLARIIDGKVVCGNEEVYNNLDVQYGFASDLMSDVLTINKDHIVLITGLANIQTIRTAEMLDIPCIIFARKKKVTAEMIDQANTNRMVIIESHNTVFKICGILFKAGLKPIY